MLPAFMEDYNARFAKEPRNAKDLHRPLAPDENLDGAFAWREERTVSASLTIQYAKMLFILEQDEFSRSLVRKRVIVSDYPDGRVVITHNGRPLPYSIFDKVRQVTQGAIVDNKQLSALADPRELRILSGRPTPLPVSNAARNLLLRQAPRRPFRLLEAHEPSNCSASENQLASNANQY